DDPVHDVGDVIRIGLKYADLIVLVDAKFHLDLCRLEAVLEAEESRVHLELVDAGRDNASLQIMDPEEAIPEGDGVRSAESVVRGIYRLLWRHAETVGIVDVGVQSLLRPWKLVPQANSLMGDLVELGTLLSR